MENAALRDLIAPQSIPFRERWGRRANRLESEGVPWPESEERAYHEVDAERAAYLVLAAKWADRKNPPPLPPLDSDIGVSREILSKLLTSGEVRKYLGPDGESDAKRRIVESDDSPSLWATIMLVERFKADGKIWHPRPDDSASIWSGWIFATTPDGENVQFDCGYCPVPVVTWCYHGDAAWRPGETAPKRPAALCSPHRTGKKSKTKAADKVAVPASMFGNV